MSKTCFPIQTVKEGNKITKICVEDVSKMFNRVRESMNISYSNISSLMHFLFKNYKGAHGQFVIGKGISQPCITDAYDEEIGNNIAFMKAKLNANIKKYRILKRMYKEQTKVSRAIFEELEKISEYIDLDLDGIRKHNPEYLKESEDWW